MSTTISSKIASRVAERNSWKTYSQKNVGAVFKMLWQNKKEVVFQRGLPTAEWLDEYFPVRDIDWERLRSPKSPETIQSTWIGHATVFVQMGNFNILTDPVFSDRCSGVQFAGPLRLRKPACTIEQMIQEEKIAIDVVLISHNHYDHLDYNSVKKIATIAIAENKPVQFVVPLGVKSWFCKYVPNSMKGGNEVIEMDWHESCIVQGKQGSKLNVTSVPTQHWSSRYGYDRDTTLWCGYSVKVISDNADGGGASLLFSGDTGWFEEAEEEIGQYGPYDLALIPIGAYEPRWFMRAEHIDPFEAVKFMDAVKAKRAFPIHWATFPLTTEPVLEPREKLEEAMKEAGKDLSTFSSSLIGETILYE